jgi:predicted AAA+ superfamily ATPase
MIQRQIKQALQSTTKSVLLLGPRQTGKSTLIRSLEPDLYIDLSDELELIRYSSNPNALKENMEAIQPKSVGIDEIQKLPKLMNSVQSLIDRNKEIKFYLTGSSARKLKRGEANLLPGRIVNFNLGPITSSELEYKMNTLKALEYGCLPEPYLSENTKDNQRILISYSANYIKEEIKAESMVRNLDSFARFLNESILHCGRFVDYTKIAKNSKISRHSIPRYFEILEDTLIGHRLFPYNKINCKLDLIKHPKFFFFDNGVWNGLIRNFSASIDRIGVLCEQLVFTQILHSSWAHEKHYEISTFRTRDGIEIDFVVNHEDQIFLVEVKNSDDIQASDLSGIQFFQKKVKPGKGFIFHMKNSEKKWDGIWSLPWQKGLKEIGL